MEHDLLITDVSPRDGLQNEPEILPVAAKAELVGRLLAAGVPRVEIGSFVSPRQVPQMAGTAELAAELRARGHDLGDAGRFTALIPNMRGFELAVAAGLRHVRLVLAASESLNRANFRRGVAESLDDFAAVAAAARAAGVGFGVAIGASFGCPFEGRVPPDRVLEIAGRLAALGADEIILADTTGMAVPTQVAALCRAALGALAGGGRGERSTLRPYEGAAVRGGAAHHDPHGAAVRGGAPTLTIHLHNTRNTGYANALAAWQAGVRSLDASLGGIGGCPFAPRAVGNIATEDAVHMFNGMGVATGIDLSELLAAAGWLGEQMGKALPALVGKAEPVYLRHGDTQTRRHGDS